jgi:hypothetical protein
MRLLIAVYKEPLLRVIWRQPCFSLLRRRVRERPTSAPRKTFEYRHAVCSDGDGSLPDKYSLLH